MVPAHGIIRPFNHGIYLFGTVWHVCKLHYRDVLVCLYRI